MKTKKALVLTVFAGILGICLAAAPARAEFYDFDSLPAPGPSPLVLPGVTINPSEWGGIVNIGDFAPSAPNAYEADVETNFGTSTYQLLTITFDRPVFWVKFQMWNFGDKPVTKGWVNALDGNGNLLDSQGLLDFSEYKLIFLSGKGIKSLVFKQTVNSFPGFTNVRIDNFSFSLAPGAAVVPLF